MSCDYENLIPEFLTDSLDEDERETFLEHLGACQSCSGTLHSFRNVDKVLRTMERPEPDAQLLAGYHAGLEAQFDNAGFLRHVSNTIADFLRSQRQPESRRPPCRGI